MLFGNPPDRTNACFFRHPSEYTGAVHFFMETSAVLMGFRGREGVVFLFLLSVSSGLFAGPPVATTDPLSPSEQRAKFKLPQGFEIQLVASEPDIQKPMNLAFDAKGRLWVTHSIEYPFAAENADQSRDGITVLDGIGADGKATKVTKFADRVNIPIGILPMPNGREVIVWSIPNIWKLTDTDGDGKADKREILYGPFDFVDTHGNQNSFRLGLDGWIYACHGFRNASKIKLKGEGPVVLEMQSGNTYRFKPDGSAIEQLTWGQVNPFGMCVDFRGDLFNADCHSKPISLLLRGGYYDSFGKPHDGLGFAPDFDIRRSRIDGNRRGRRVFVVSFSQGVRRFDVCGQCRDEHRSSRSSTMAGFIPLDRKARGFPHDR